MTAPTLAVRPPCPACDAPVSNLQLTPGLVATYPCGCWLLVEEAQDLADEYGVTIRG